MDELQPNVLSPPAPPCALGEFARGPLTPATEVAGRFTRLALAVARSVRLGEDADGAAAAAMGELNGMIRRFARMAAGRGGGMAVQSARDFVDGAPQFVWSKIVQFEQWYFHALSDAARADAGVDRFPTWLSTVIRNHHVDHVRSAKRETPVARLSGRETRDFRRDPPPRRGELSREQLDAIREWRPVDGVIAFSLGGLWPLVPGDLWDHWLAEAGVRPPFPPPDFAAAPRRHKRAMLAEALNMRPNTLDARWSRFARNLAGK